MYRIPGTAWRHGVVAFSLAGLLSCGGGSSAPSSSPANVLIPPAPVAGEVLYADASVLRPLRNGSRYVYRGEDRPQPLSIPIVYSNSVVQSAGNGGSDVAEVSSNWFQQGTDSSVILSSNGSVRSRQVVDFGAGGPAPTVEAIELRSPVRASDQYTVLEQRFEGALPDIDKDGKPEAIDVAAYRRVIGNESVTLRHSGSFVALRIDYIARARVQRSADLSFGPIVELVLSSWYAPGIGIVRQRYTVPTPGGEPQVRDEQLLTWDGLSEGLGFMAPTLATVPQESPAAPGAHLPALFAADRSGSGAIVLTAVPAELGYSGTTLSRLNGRGQVTQSRVFKGWNPRLATLLAVGDEIAVVQQSPDWFGYRLAAFDAGLEPRTDVQGAALDLGPTDPDIGSVIVNAVAGDGLRVWVLYARVRSDRLGGGAQLLLQAFDTSARPIGPSHELDNLTLSKRWPTSSLTAADGRVVVTWSRFNALGDVNQLYAVFESPDSTPAIHTLADNIVNPYPNVHARIARGDVTFAWSGFLDAANTTSRPEEQLRGVTLGLDEAPQRSTSGTIDNEIVSGTWPKGSSSGYGGLYGDSRQLVFVGGVNDYAWPPFDRFESRMTQIAVVAIGSGPIAERAASARVHRIPTELVPFVWSWHTAILIEDRLLLLGSDNGRLATAVQWLR